MIKVKEVNGDCCFWSEEGCWPQAKPEVLGGHLNILAIWASTVINEDSMDAIQMEDDGL